MRLILAAALLLAMAALPAAAGELTLITEEGYPPSSMVVSGRLTGSSVEVVREIQRRLGDTTEIIALPWARGYQLAQGKPGVALFATGRLPEREALFSWVGPILRLEWVFYAFKGREPVITRLEDAKQLKGIGTVRDDAKAIWLRSQGFTNLESVSRVTQNVKMLEAGKIDVFIYGSSGLEQILGEAGLSRDQLVPVYTVRTQDAYIAFSRGTDPAVVDAWEKALGDIKADGTFAAIYARWLPGANPP